MNKLICQICNKNCNGLKGLGTHVGISHKNISIEKYYSTYISKNKIKCVICGLNTKFINLNTGYRKYCSRKCVKINLQSQEIRDKLKKTCFEKYVTENPASSLETKNKISVSQKKRLTDPKERKKISIATKKAMESKLVKQNFENGLKTRNRNEKWRVNLKKSAKEKFIKDPTLKSRLYTTERNQKISNSKKLYWKTHPEERKRIMDIWKSRSETSLETKMYNFLDSNQIKYTKQYELNGKIFDAHLSDLNLLFEFDGDFWHKQTLEECKYSFQSLNYYNDLAKNEIAKKHNIPLFRIRENDSPETILECIKSVKPILE